MKPIYINFLTIQKKSRKQKATVLLLVIGITLYLAGDSAYTFHKQKQIISSYKIKTERQIPEKGAGKAQRRQYKKLSDREIEELRMDTDFVNKLLKYRAFPWIDTLNRLESSIDNGIMFTFIDIDRNSKKLALKGRADSAENLSAFIKAISSERLFLLNSLSQESKQAGAIDFDMGITIK